jgi:hypothetical protein
MVGRDNRGEDRRDGGDATATARWCLAVRFRRAPGELY